MMKRFLLKKLKLIFLTFSLLTSFSIIEIQAQNLVTNGDFEDGVINSDNNVEGWGGFNNRILIDNVTDERTGHINVNEGSLFQVFSVVPGETYNFSFEYRWLNNNQPNMNMTVRVRDEDTNDIIKSIDLSQNEGTWASVDDEEVTIPVGVDQVRIQFFKGDNNKPFRIDNVVFEPEDALPCVPPTSVANASLASEAASFTWNSAPSEEDGYNWVVVEDGDDPDEAADVLFDGSVSSGETRVIIDGLTENTNYDLYVRTICAGTEESDWSGPVSFTPSFQGNLITNSRFTLNGTTSSVNSWEGFNQNSRKDNINGDFVGFIDNDGTLRQDVPVVPGVEYVISFNYRWVGIQRPQGNDITPQVRNPNVGGGAGILAPLPLTENDDDTWYTVHFTYTLPESEGIDEIRLQFFKGVDRNQLHLSNVTILENIDVDDEADFVYKNGAWSPSNPEGTAESGDEIYIYNGFAEIENSLEANNFEVTAWADVDIKASVDLTGDFTSLGKVNFKNDENVLGQLRSANATGTVTVERYNSAKRAFRLVSSSVDSDHSIFHNWQEGGRTIANLGTHITGSTEGEDGFDATLTGNPSLFTFDNTVADQSGGSAWNAVNNTNLNALEAGKLYRILVRGDRSIDLSTNDAVPTETSLRATGTLKSGNQTTGIDLPALSTEDENFSAIGNPYQAIVDAQELTYNGDVNSNFIYVWAATESTLGQYVTISTDNSEAPDPSDSGASKFIMPGQAFFVRNNLSVSDTPSITFTESSKATEEPQTDIFNEGAPLAYINMRLYKTEDLNNGITEVDAIGFRFSDDFTNQVSDEDAAKLGNPNENLAIINDGLLAIEKREMPVDEEIIELFVNSYSSVNYTFQMLTEHLPENTKVFIEDTYTDESIVLENESNYSFSVDPSIAESVAFNRFKLTFEVETFSTEDFTNDFGISIYPNPVQNLLAIDFNSTEKVERIQLFDQLGRLIKAYNEPQQLKFDVSELQTGMYFIQISTENSKHKSKFIKK